jgi:polar amino acid transport system substrate-binding protein
VSRRALAASLAVLGSAIGLAACGTGSTEAGDRALGVLSSPPTSTTTTTAAPPSPSCGDPWASYPALSPLPARETLADDPAIARIIRRGRLVVAVDENTEGLASRNSDGQLEGLEIDVARAIASSLLGDGADAEPQFLTVTTKQKTDYPADGKADVAISAISMTCERWDKVAFSTEYFTAHHEFLVRKDAPVRIASDLAGRRVCMTKGSTSIGTLARLDLQPPPRPRLVDARTDCLVALQEGEVDAYFGHDTFLVGMIDQDPGLRIVPQGEPQHYGIAVGPHDVTFVRYVNGVLDHLRADGTLAKLYERWLEPLYRGAGQPLPAVPEPDTARLVPAEVAQ